MWNESLEGELNNILRPDTEEEKLVKDIQCLENYGRYRTELPVVVRNAIFDFRIQLEERLKQSTWQLLIFRYTI